ncbi:hypothetical protein HMPREF2600_11460 [Neisseria sp. HMSC077D05]|jgi:hypothetical protein|uniref:PD-(D/E)XK nuclease family protein n=1 Tax=Neisseria sp. HMSC077D05 TaxID=1715079 RepID=UPI0008A4DD4D|nr:PD-(D/E)XK nuclease family protein [Neisseria sp. HMSC077D05]OFN30797.1 hypothetical protein HMPREF2600_11460 [Neisseria sp. HMSC077D05]
MKPNIFDIATKELNQDAFITWLLMFADEECKGEDKALNECAREFVTELIKSQYPNFDEKITSVKAGRQRENIDIWAEVDDRYFIVIEDKTNTKEHSNQLNRYKEAAERMAEGKSIVCIYIKTGNENKASLTRVENKGFKVFDRKNLIRILEQYTDIKNNIFVDFLERIKRMEDKNNQFGEIAITEWQGSDWQGFFQFLENELEEKLPKTGMWWDYANNPSGGFWWYAFSKLPLTDKNFIYMQLEQSKARLCFKVSISDESAENDRRQIRNKLSNLFISEARKEGFSEIKKPERFGKGKTMTFAVVEREGWFGNDKLDRESVIKNILKYQEFFIAFQKKFKADTQSPKQAQIPSLRFKK